MLTSVGENLSASSHTVCSAVMKDTSLLAVYQVKVSILVSDDGELDGIAVLNNVLRHRMQKTLAGKEEKLDQRYRTVH